MPTYKLMYFHSRGLAEVTRYLFAAAGVEYEDVRFTGEEWEKTKEEHNSPFGQLPILKVDNKVYCQSHAIAHFVAREFGLAGKNSEEEYTTYVLQGAFSDLLLKLSTANREKDPEKKAEMQKDVFGNFIPSWLRALEEIFQQGKGAYFVGDGWTIADFYFLHASEYLKGINPQTLDEFPGLNGLFNRLVENPKIAEWREKRPLTQY